MSKSKIQWTEFTWNPVRGCSRVSEGCRNCYAERWAAGPYGVGSPSTGEKFAIFGNAGPRWTGKVELIPSMLDVPLRRRKPTTYFVNSMSDLFHEGLSDEAIERVFAVMALSPQHTFQVLTKRAARMARWFNEEQPLSSREEFVAAQAAHTGKVVWDSRGSDRSAYWGCGKIGDLSNRLVWPGWPLPNVWLGVSVEDRAHKDRVEQLRNTPAAVRFLSLEPLLEDLGALDLTGIGWVIVGGESGPGSRPCRVEWIERIASQCGDAGVSCFVKQLGAFPVWAGAESSPIEHGEGKNGDPAKWPESLRVRQMPVATDEALAHLESKGAE